MAIAFDAESSNAAGGSTGSSVTVSHTCTGSNLILWVYVNIFRAAGAGDEITGVTYNGVAMTQAKKLAARATAYMYLYYLVAPATGTHDVVASFSASQDEVYCRNASYTGASQTGVPDATGTQGPTDGVTSITVNTTTVANNCWIVGGFYGETGNLSAGTNTTLRNAASARPLGDTNAAQTPAGTYGLAVSSASTRLAAISSSFAPAVAVTSHNLTLLGIGA